MNNDNSKHSFCVETPVGWMRFEATEKRIIKIIMNLAVGAYSRISTTGALGAVSPANGYTPLQKRQTSIEKYIIKWLNNYFNGKSQKPFPWKWLDVSSGTRFQQKVWKQLWKIPFGQVRSYKWVAEKVGNPRAARAVGQANKKNHLPLVIPCHRVIASDGGLGGYACGVRLKRKLLKHEFTTRYPFHDPSHSPGPKSI